MWRKSIPHRWLKVYQILKGGFIMAARRTAKQKSALKKAQRAARKVNLKRGKNKKGKG